MTAETKIHYMDKYAPISEKRAHIASLFQMALADSEIAGFERFLINGIAKTLDLDYREVEKIKDNPSAYKSVSFSEEDRMIQFFQIVQLARIDLRIEKSEVEMLEVLAHRLRIPEFKMDELMSRLKGIGVLDYQEFKQILKESV